MRILILIFLLFNTSCESTKKSNFNFTLKKGDILFQDLDSSPLCDAIELVTPGYKNANLSHIGIVVKTGSSINEIRILEAIPNHVKTTRIDSFLNRSFDKRKNPKVIVGRLKEEYRHTILEAINFLTKKIGEKYDDAFLLNNDSYYCSELIYEAFLKDSIFELNNMTFLNPQNNDTLEVWKEYYNKLETSIPQNEKGINPGIMSLSEKIEIIHYYGMPSGMTK